MTQQKSKTGTKKSTTVHIEMSGELESWIRNLAQTEERSVRKMILFLLKEARKAREEHK